MAELRAFKSGKDLRKAAEEETATCVGCGTSERAERAYENGWQFAPEVCPDCLSWSVIDTDGSEESEMSAAAKTIEVERYGRRFWSVREDGELLCVAVYRKGANAVKARIEELIHLINAKETAGKGDASCRI